MKKIKLLNLIMAHGLFVLIFLFVLNNKLKAQARHCEIDNYLVPFNASSHSGSFPRSGPVMKNFVKVSKLEKIIDIYGRKRSILLAQYKFNSETFINIGKTKVKNDSAFYFNIDNVVSAFFHIKKPCSIKLIGYEFFKSGELKSYFELSSDNCRIIFSIQILKPDVVIDQYDTLR